jgi:SAM-dependent methyltransferase
LFIVFLFIPLGQATGREMGLHEAVPAYIVNLIASLVGVWLFTLLSYWETPPVVWFLLAGLGMGYYLYSKEMLNISAVVIFAVMMVGLVNLGRGTIWSPYHRLDFFDLYFDRESNGEGVDVGYSLMVQQVFYQAALNLSEEFVSSLDGDVPDITFLLPSYDMPYQLGLENPKVLVVGGGMGNDAAAGLRNNASHVTSVEIDPAIIRLGKENHPEAPYTDPRVTVVEDDARSFFHKSTETYDLIVFGFLDSQTLLSGLSNVRLDSFVYTQDSLEQAQKLLKKDGIVVLSFAAGEPWIEERLGKMMVNVFGADNVYLFTGSIGVSFVAGPISPEDQVQAGLAPWEPSADSEDIPIANDDWPYLYLRARKVPTVYWQAILVIGLACWLMLSRSFKEALKPNWHFWFLGAAFLLIEFKSVTELALLFGTTWLVNTFAISGVLLMALAANFVVLRRPRLRLQPLYVQLFLSLALNYFFPLDLLNNYSVLARAVGGMALLSLPLFFAGLIFSESLRRSGDTASALGSNLSGSVAGGILEYGSLYWGIKSLYILAALVYLAAWIAFRLQKD